MCTLLKKKSYYTFPILIAVTIAILMFQYFPVLLFHLLLSTHPSIILFIHPLFLACLLHFFLSSFLPTCSLNCQPSPSPNHLRCAHTPRQERPDTPQRIGARRWLTLQTNLSLPFPQPFLHYISCLLNLYL